MRRSGIMFMFLVMSGFTSLANAITIDISPTDPTTSYYVTIDVLGGFPDTGQGLLNTTFTITDFNIEIDVIMQDVHGSGAIILPQLTDAGGTAVIDPLPQGVYDVTGNVFVIPWGDTIPALYQSGNASFEVVPEPASILLLLAGIPAMKKSRT